MFLGKDINNVLRRRMEAILIGLLLVTLVSTPEVSGATLNELVGKAKEEGAVNVTVTSSLTGRTIPNLAAAFKRRFGLDIKVSVTGAADIENYPRAIAETRTGAVPTYDAMEGVAVNNMPLLEAGGIHKVDGWEFLLAEINPLVRSGKVRPEQISRAPLSGYGFMYASRVGALLYNSRLISREELPKTHAELADLKYKGRWTQPPWTTDWDIAPVVFPDLDNGKWLEVVRRAGRNAGAVLQGLAGFQRMLLGEFAFMLGNTYYVHGAKAKDPQAPVEITYFQDYNWSNNVFYIVRKESRHPAAATLFALWMTTPEAESIWQPELFMTQFLWGESDLDKKERQFIKESGAKIVDYWSAKGGQDLLVWYGTEEGKKFRQAVARGMKGE